MTIRCTRCNTEYPSQGLPYNCPACGGIFDFSQGFPFETVDRSSAGVWRYRSAFGVPGIDRVISLGEGNTPLIDDRFQGGDVFYKLESQNPTGSYKDRGTTVMMSVLASRGIRAAVEDSSGNAGASFAAYAARAGVDARVFVPASASGPKRKQIEAYGAELVCIEGPRSAAAEAVQREITTDVAYASHAYLPFGMAGIATIAYEIWETLGDAPGSVIAPVGHGSLLLGIVRGFTALRQAGKIQRLPVFIGVQAANCAPLWSRLDPEGHPGAVVEGKTIAEGVRVAGPIRGDTLVKEIAAQNGEIVAIPENEILPARDDLARRGIYCEPTSALVFAALKQINGSIPEPAVLIVTGSGYKFLS